MCNAVHQRIKHKLAVTGSSAACCPFTAATHTHRNQQQISFEKPVDEATAKIQVACPSCGLCVLSDLLSTAGVQNTLLAGCSAGTGSSMQLFMKLSAQVRCGLLHQDRPLLPKRQLHHSTS